MKKIINKLNVNFGWSANQENKMKIRGKKRWLMLFGGVFIAFTVYAATPASKAYLDSKMAVIQAEIDEISNYLAINGL